MANNSGAHYNQQQQQQQQQQSSSPFQCKECRLFLDSAESLNVHLQYSHKENLLNKWSTQDGSMKNEENNNGKSSMIKREFPMNNSSSSDNSDSLAKSDNEYNRTSPEHVYGHPPTPQSNHSLSPYQNQENSAFSPHFQNYQQIKVEQLSPNQQFHQYPIMNEQQSFYPLPQFDTVNQNQVYEQDYPVHQSNIVNPYRYNPYQRPQQPPISSVQLSSGQVYPPQPTPSPSPQTCDKCGLICNSASQLVDHINMSHPPTPAPHLNSYQGNQHYLFGNESQQMANQIKTEEQSEILDLDSHQVFSKDDKRNNTNQAPQIPHNVSSMVGNWQTQPQSNMQAQIQDRMAINNGPMKRFGQPPGIDQKLFQPVQAPNGDFMSNGVAAPQRLSPTSNFGGAFDHLPTQSTNAVISTPQVPNVPAQAPAAPTKSATWKSNEARRPKTYNCTACNKWFTSSGHLKRHYNTTLHKNAVKSSGQPDPASLPISAHHHPARDNANSRDGRTSSSPNSDSRLDDGSNLSAQYERPAPMPGHLQQPPNGPYDRQQQPNVPPLNTNLLHSPTLVSPMLSLNNLSSNGNSPNGEAGPSTLNLESRGLLPLSSNTHTIPPGFSMAPHLMSMEASQYQMYPNEEAPHVTQDMAINSLNTSGEEFISTSFNRNSQLLPSFDEIQSLRFGNRSFDDASVGGGVSATNPYVFLTENYDNAVAIPEEFNKENFDDNRLGETDGSIYVYPTEAVYVLPDSPYLDLANNNNVLDGTKWTNFTKSPEQDALMIRDEPTHPDSTVQNAPATEKPIGEFVCVECDKKFNKACYLTQHNKNTHSGEKPFKCTRCGKRYNDQTSYEVHVAKHGDDKPHKCSKCKKMFNHKTDLRRHMFCHAGIKPHYCETCHKGFIRKDHMLKHVETHKRRAQMKGTTGRVKRR
ncbi:uncharacterized protein LOC123311531 [Coccinella septempunctata]|uniref:uncharacterized protein LOC123311531 n=1 Tax=Coccinella septempunctata TaxID=41139 RepID=UPI001D08E4B8|nr:uncharacterized protein LOC123311531 [Coccinella septempunctata]